MGNRLLIGVIGLVGLSTTVSAADLWHTKPVREWTREETQKFLRDSPWAHQVVVGGSLLDTGTPEDTAGERAGVGEASGAAGREQRTSVDVPISGPAGTAYFVEWTSAKIVRQAWSHVNALQSQRTAEDAEPPPSPLYVLSIGGANLKAFEGLTEDQLKAGSYLHSKHSKNKVQPIEVKIRKAQDGRVVAVQFAFPHEVGGQPVVPDQEKSVEFSCKLRDFTIRTSFNLAKMTTAQGRDL